MFSLLENFGNVRAQITDTENMSILMLTYSNPNEIKNPRHNSRIKYTCAAQNTHGKATNQFEIKVGRLPESPEIISIDYKEGFGSFVFKLKLEISILFLF